MRWKDFIKNKQAAKIQNFEGDALLQERLREMGLYPGLEIKAIGQAPFGGAYLIQYGATILALRKEEAVCIQLS